MQGPFTQNESTASKGEFLFYLVDATDGITPETGEGGGQPQIRKAGATTWTNTSATLVHVGNGHYMFSLTSSELDTLGAFSIRYSSANTAEFQDTGRVTATSDEVSLDEVNSELAALRRDVKSILAYIKRPDSANQDLQPVSPL